MKIIPTTNWFHSEKQRDIHTVIWRVYDVRTRRDANLVDPTVVLGTCVDIFPYDGVVTEESDRKKMKPLQIFHSTFFFEF